MALPGRTDAGRIQAVVVTDPEDSTFDQFIDPANDLVTELCVPPGVYNANRLLLIETWLAAHFYSCFRRQRTQEQADIGVMDTYESKVDFKLSSTVAGQQAMILDTQGTLAVLNNGQNKFAKAPAALGIVVGANYLGTKPRRNCGGGW